MYRVVIVEDNEVEAAELAAMITASSCAKELGPAVVAHDAASGLEAIHSGCDILFTDILLGNERVNGIDLVVALASRMPATQVIYMSGCLEYAPDLYRTKHTWFLAKPFEQVKLEAALCRALENLSRERSAPLLVRNNGSLIQMVPERVMYVESDRRKVRIHEAERTVEIYSKLSEIEHSLPNQFVRCHKSFLVNMDCIAELNSTSVAMSNGDVIPVSQRCRKMLHDRFVEHVGRLL